jgi:hypothetical protein
MCSPPIQNAIFGSIIITMFTKHTQSEGHEVVSPEEHEVIEDHTRRAGQERVSKLNEVEQDLLRKDLEELEKHKHH